MSKNEHLVDWVENEHKTNPKGTGCLWRNDHNDSYSMKKFPRCNYRKNAHDYSKGAEQHVYNIPSFRAPERWVQVWVDMLGPTVFKSGTIKPGSHPPDPLKNNSWHLTTGTNFQKETEPFWHNTHHVIACGEIKAAFPKESEQKVILKSRWNINEMPNVIILPKQYVVARILKLPTHVPPDGATEHEHYSENLGVRLNGIKAKLAANQSATDHELTDANKDACRQELEKASTAIRKFLIDSGDKNPGINLDNLRLDSVNW